MLRLHIPDFKAGIEAELIAGVLIGIFGEEDLRLRSG